MKKSLLLLLLICLFTSPVFAQSSVYDVPANKIKPAYDNAVAPVQKSVTNIAQTGTLSTQTPVAAKASAPVEVVSSTSSTAVPVATPKAALVSGPSSTDNTTPAAAPPVAKPVVKPTEKNSAGQQ